MRKVAILSKNETKDSEGLPKKNVREVIKELQKEGYEIINFYNKK